MILFGSITWILFALLNLFLLGVTITTKWVRVSHRNKAGAVERFYLLPVTRDGKPRRFDGASQQLFALLTIDVLARAKE